MIYAVYAFKNEDGEFVAVSPSKEGLEPGQEAVLISDLGFTEAQELTEKFGLTFRGYR